MEQKQSLPLWDCACQTAGEVLSGIESSAQQGADRSSLRERIALASSTGWSCEDKARRYNASKGDEVGLDCDICNNKGLIMVIRDNIEFYEHCICQEARRSQRRLEKSGLTDMVARYRFDTFETKSKHQQMMKDGAEAFCEQGKGWFYIGGQPGCGKTHICTAIASHFVNAGLGVQYMVWMEEVTKLKAVKLNDEAYAQQMQKWKEAPVLYVDDFFKTEKGKQPTGADVNIAFELLNHRYNDIRKITILSGEHPIGEIIAIDEALGSRLNQRCGIYKITIGADQKKNYRLQTDCNMKK